MWLSRTEVCVGYRIVEVQSTPNPNALKFILDRAISDQPISFFNASAAMDHALARDLFTIDGVTTLLLLGDFVTVNKRADKPWAQITPKVTRMLETS
jgi:hypothetical protein